MAIENISIKSLNQSIRDYTSSIFNRDSKSTDLSISDIANRVREVYDKDGKEEAVKEAVYLILLLKKNGQKDFAQTVLDQLSPNYHESSIQNATTDKRFETGQWVYLTEKRIAAWPIQIRFYYNNVKDGQTSSPEPYLQRMENKPREAEQKSVFEKFNPLNFKREEKICSSLIKKPFPRRREIEEAAICLPASKSVKPNSNTKLKTFFSKIFSKPCPPLQETYKLVEVILQASPQESRAILEDSGMRDKIIKFFQPRQTLILMESLLATSMLWDNQKGSDDLIDFILLYNFRDRSRETNTFVNLKTTDCLGVILYSAYLAQQITRREITQLFLPRICLNNQCEIQKKRLEADQRSKEYSSANPPLPGDLLEFDHTSKFDHKMLYVGNGMALSFWHMPRRDRISLIDLSKMTHGKNVKITTLEPYWIRPDKKKK